MIEELLLSYMTKAKMETSKEDSGAEAMEKGGECLGFMVFRVVRWWLLLQAM